MNFEFLESFRIFAKTLNFTHAAAERHVSQPALHKQIQSLAESLEVQLYERRGRNLNLTAAGVKLARFAHEMRDRVQQLQAQLVDSDSGATVTLAAGRGSAMYLLSEALQDFGQQFPNSARVITANQTETLAAIRNGEAHLGVTVLTEPPRDLNSTLLHELTPRLIVSEDHPLVAKKFVRLKALDGLPLICPPAPSPMRATIASWFELEGLRFNPVMDAEGWDLLMHFASLGFGAAIVNGCCRPPERAVAVRLPDLPKTRYYLVSHRDEFQFPQLQALRSAILKNARNVRLFD